MKALLAATVAISFAASALHQPEPEHFTSSKGLTDQTIDAQTICLDFVYQIGVTIPPGHRLADKPDDIYMRCMVRHLAVF